MRWVFGADTTPFRKGLDEMRTQTKAFSGSVKGMIAGALGTAAITAGIKNLLDEMGRIDDLAKRFGTSAESIQKVGFAAQLAGSDLEGVAKALTVVTKNANNAATNGGSMADSFAAIGIDAGKFVNMPIEEKLVALSEAFKSGKGSGQNLAMMMDVLGKSGAELIPLLSEGPEKLLKTLEETAVVSTKTVEKLALFGDKIDEMKQKFQVFSADLLMIFEMIGGGIGAVAGHLGAQFTTSISLIMDQAKAAGSVMSKLFNGDLEGASKGIQQFKENFSTAFDVAKQNAIGFRKDLDAVLSGGGPGGGNKGPLIDVESIAEAESAEKERLKIVEEIAKLKEEAAQAELTIAEKILALEEKRAKLKDEIDFLDPEDTLKSQKELLEGDKELKKLREDQAKIDEEAAKKQKDLDDKAAKEAEKKALDLQRAKDEEKQVDRDIKFGGLDDQGKLSMLKEEQAKLLKESKDALTEEEAIKLRTAAKLKGTEIADLEASIADSNKGPTIAASSLASIGAGGSANIIGNTTIEQRKVSLLEQIAANTGRTETGSPKLPEPI